jgi:hypothetical protein
MMVVLLALAGADAALAQSVTYRCVDNGGRSTYTNIKAEMAGKKCTVVSREVSVVPAQQVAKPARSESARTPGERVGAGTQRGRDETRQKILQEELGIAEKRLSEARQKLAEQRGGDETGLKPYQEEIERQEQNVASLRRELAR